MTQPIPIFSGDPRDPAPHLYRVERRKQLCLHCARSHEWTQVWAQTNLRPVSQSPTGRYLSNLRAINSIRDITWNIPIHIVDLPITEVPFCHDCATSVSLKHLPTVPVAERIPANPLHATPGWRRAEATTKPKKPEKKAEYTLDDIL